MPAFSHAVVLDAKGHFWDAAWVCAKQWELEGKPIKMIARWLNVSPSTVKYNLPLAMPSLRPDAKPPRLPDARAALIVQRRVLVDRLVMETKATHRGPRRAYPSAMAIARAINLDPTNNILTNKYCVQRDLGVLGYKSLKRQRGPKRIATDHANRITACHAFLRMKTTVLKLVCFSDTKFFDSNDHGAEREWCKGGVQPTRMERDTWAPRVHVWGVIGINVKFLVRLEKGRLTAETYKKQCLYPLVAHLKAKGIPHTAIILQLDGETAMNSGVAKEYLATKGIRVLERWPARSPDLSGIENMWAIIQKRVDSHGPSDAEALWLFVKKEWDAIPDAEVRALVDSFPRRCKRCVEGGGVTICTKFEKKDR